MDINRKQSQFELFPGTPGSSQEAEKPRYLFTHFTLSLENLVVFSIISIIILVLSFSLGVEKGKRTVKHLPETKVPAVQAEVPQSPVAEKETPVVVKVTPQPEVSEQAVPKIEPREFDEAKYTIQVASFKTQKYARIEASNLRKKGYDIFVLPKGKYSIVCVGKFVDQQEAREFSRKLRHQYQDFLIRRL